MTDTVRIPKIEYDSLLGDRERLKRVRFALGILPSPGSGHVSKIDRDEELAAFILECFQRYKLIDIALLCREKFGPKRAPSKSAIYRFWARQNASKRVIKHHLKPASNDH